MIKIILRFFFQICERDDSGRIHKTLSQADQVEMAMPADKLLLTYNKEVVIECICGSNYSFEVNVEADVKSFFYNINSNKNVLIFSFISRL